MTETDLLDVRKMLQENRLDGAEERIRELFSTATESQQLVLLELESRIARSRGDLSLAASSLEKALAKAEAKDLIRATLLHNLSMIYDLEQQYGKAIPLAEEELSILRAVLPDTDKRIADCLLSLGKHHYELGRFSLARDFIEDACARYTKQEGRKSLGVSACLNNLGRILENENENEQAVPLFREAVAIRKELLGRHAETAFTLLNLGTCLAGIGSYKEAMAVLLECRDMYMDLGLEESPYLEACRANLMHCWNQVSTPC